MQYASKLQNIFRIITLAGRKRTSRASLLPLICRMHFIKLSCLFQVNFHITLHICHKFEEIINQMIHNFNKTHSNTEFPIDKNN